MFSYEIAHIDTTPSAWEQFKKQPSFVIEEVVDRCETALPEFFMPMARGVVIASDMLLRLAGYHPACHQLAGWHAVQPNETYRKSLPGSTDLSVHRWGNLWVVGRERMGLVCECLVLSLGTPICTRAPEAAMALAEYCNISPIGRWVAWATRMLDNALGDAIERARERRITENLVLCAPERAARFRQYLATVTPAQRTRFHRRAEEAALRSN